MLRLLGRPWAFRRVLGMAGGGVSFVGAYDTIPSIVAAYGMRRLKASYTGSLVRLRRASDNAESDFGYDANGDLDTAAIATWLTATTGYAVTWYDQSGGGKDVTQSTATKQTTYSVSVQNSHPGFLWNDTDNGLIGSANSGFSGGGFAITMLAVVKPTGSPLPYSTILAQSPGSNNLGMGFNWSSSASGALTTDQYMPAGRTTTSTTLLASGTGALVTWRVPTWSSHGTTAEAFVNGASKTTTNYGAGGTPNLTAGPLRVGNWDTTRVDMAWVGYICELIVCNTALSSGDRGAAEAAANAYWSVY